MRIAVIGTGYVGLVTGTCLAESGNEVIGIDKDADKIAVLESGRLPLYEPDCWNWSSATGGKNAFGSQRIWCKGSVRLS